MLYVHTAYSMLTSEAIERELESCIKCRALGMQRMVLHTLEGIAFVGGLFGHDAA